MSYKGDDAHLWLDSLCRQVRMMDMKTPIPHSTSVFATYKKQLATPGLGPLMRERWLYLLSGLKKLVNENQKMTPDQMTYVLAYVLPLGRNPLDSVIQPQVLLPIIPFINTCRVTYATPRRT